MGNKKRVKNKISPICNMVKPPKLLPYHRQEQSIIFDLSFPALFSFVNRNDYTNYLKDETDFIQHYKMLMDMIQVLKKKSFTTELINTNSYRHCHKVHEQCRIELLRKVVIAALENIQLTSDFWDQYFGDEEFFQLGTTGSLRMFGIYNEERHIFYVVLLDWHHQICWRQECSRVDRKVLKFSGV